MNLTKFLKRPTVGLVLMTVSVLASINVAQSAAQEAGPPPAAPTQAAPDAAAGGVAIEFTKDAGIGSSAAGLSARTQAEQFKRDRFPARESEAGLLIYIGSASVPCGPDDAAFQQCRRQAFDEALLMAKADLAEFLRAEVETSLMSRINEPGDSESVGRAASPPVSKAPPGLLEKAVAILNHEVDKELARRGIKLGGEGAEEAKKEVQIKILSQSDFQSAVRVTALAGIAALQSYRTFEGCGSDGKCDIAVIAIVSTKSEALHAALMGIGEPPRSDCKMDIGRWAEEQGPNVLLYTHGAQARTNAKGEVVLVGFGQASVVTDSGRSVDAARQKAKMKAQGALRQFMGELVTVNGAAVEASISLEAAEKSDSRFRVSESFVREIMAVGEKLGMAGMREVFSWEFVHPASGKMVYGSVVMLSYSQVLAANKMFEDFKKAGGARGGAGTFGIKPPPEPAKTPAPAVRPTGKASSGKGAEGEEP